MQTVTIDIINSRAIKLLKELELLQLIHFRKDEKKSPVKLCNWAAKYKGSMTKQSITDVDDQLNELRNEWE